MFLGSKMWHSLFGGSGDYSGDGVNDVVIQIHDGDSTTTIGKTLEEHKVVATVKAFVAAAEGNTAISAIQPGFYKVRTRSRRPMPLPDLPIRRTASASW